MHDQILAKINPIETLFEHTKNVMAQWGNIKKRYSDVLSFQNLWDTSLLSVIFHDIGKVIDNFQELIGPDRKIGNNIRHEFISGIILYSLKPDFFTDHPMSLLAVFSHHKLLNDEIFDSVLSKTLKTDLKKFDFILDEFCNLAKNNLIELNKESIEKSNILTLPVEKLYQFFKKLYEILICKIETYNQRKEYIFYKGVLNISDWLGSAHQNMVESVEYNKDYLKNKIINKLLFEKKILKTSDFQFKPFQVEAIKKGNIIAIAPTGSGKTEASLLWASLKEKDSKIFYLLPTRVTSNSIFKRLRKYFGLDNVALIHSSAFLFNKSLDDNYNRSDYLLDKTFFKPVNVGTIDQILTMGFNIGFWEIKTFNMTNSYVIIDEIHLYEPYTLGLIIKSIEYLKNDYNVKFFIMSATLPLKLKELLINSLEDNLNIIEDKALLDDSRNKFEIRDCYIDELGDEIHTHFGKKILIVVNTVNEAIRLFEEISSQTKNVLCYHSRFTQRDRIKKETIISKLEEKNTNYILIATQVVEVSLDIDFDIMYTENAPIDALIQRAGRVNRKRTLNRNSRIIVFKNSDISREFVYSSVKEYNILEKTFDLLRDQNNKNLTERQLLLFIDTVYSDFDFTNSESYLNGIRAYSEFQNQFHFIIDNPGLGETYTREGLNNENIIPGCYLEKLSGINKVDRSNFEISIKRNKLQYLKSIKQDDSTYLLDCEYTYKRGLKFKPNKENEFLSF